MKNNKLNFIFWGTPDVASETLEILKGNGYMPSLIITAPDKPQGRKMIITPPAVKVWAIKNNIPYLQPEELKKEMEVILKASLQADFSIVVAYGKIIPENIINLPRLGFINIHYSLLPKYRGASPVESAILNGDKETGITIQKIEYKMDTGHVMAKEKVKIGNEEKAPDLRKRLIKIGGELLVKILPDFIDEKIKLFPQNESEATYCKKINKEDGLVNLATESPNVLYNKFRAYAIWPRTFFFENGKRIIITDAVLENRQFKILKIIPENGKETSYTK
ncbi:methionyl-tRNA formyltransferase [Candidatus Nomurabacteria bacterium RIFCSPHIGHO2_02_FULL_35_13]|uniref:methionyl-tRNA formyltransferase n=2 Tax=Candidatus Nomuraibacteriota TaxID=1752729 RepID=A0A1F6VPD4_9BACT|nr:MAG: Methionyl-tRNA formyltransferase [Candidatus Nomurabacteria bacterium GW2011_GWA1_35_8]OGI71531.1 MAG: methionyl-tRNA formyltransferase [Candidatus Nomurabacteria bacterium RIFCSPHIGHO2_02_FULL_35_13]